MTSRKFFFKLMLEDLKDRIWTIALASFVLFLSMPVFFMLGVNANNTARMINQTIGDSSILLPVITVVGAVICAVNGFHFLNNRSKVDYWHSLPIRREVLFAVKYVNGILIYLFSYALNLAITLAIFAADGHLTRTVFTNAYGSFLINTAAFLLFYSIALIAVFLTGHTLVTLMGILVFYFYGPCANILLYYLKEEFFRTLYTSGSGREFYGPAWCSPVNAYVFMVSDPPLMFPILMAGLLFSALALYLYKHRPSEAAGTAMAFYITRPLFKFVLLVPLTLGGGMFFMKVSNTPGTAWFLFGMILCWFAGSIFAEVIYALDFRRALNHKGTSLACLAAAICIFTIFRMDLLGYDSYLPAQEKVSEIAISFDALDRGISTYEISLDPNSSSGSYRYNYYTTSAYRLDHMSLTGKELSCAYRFAQAGAAYAKEQHRSFGDTFVSDNDAASSLYFDIKYTLNSGRAVCRRYMIHMNWNEEDQYLKEAMDQIYSSEDYKKGCYPILASDFNSNAFGGITLYGNENQSANRRLTKAQLEAFLSALQKEILNTSLEASATRKVIGTIAFNDKTEIYRSVGEYPIYETYTETLSLLESFGIDTFALPVASDLSQIEIVPENRYAETSAIYPEMVTKEPFSNKYMNDGIMVTDQEEMLEILSCITSTQGNAAFYRLYTQEAIYLVYAICQNEYGDLEVLGRYYLLESDMPEFLKSK